MICDEFTEELFDLYAIGCLEKPDSDTVRAHLDTGCDRCGPRFIRALMQAARISETVPQMEPPANLRERISASVAAAKPVAVMPQRKARPVLIPWLAAAASLTALVVGIGYEENDRHQAAAITAAAVEATNHAAAERTAAMLSILQAPGTKQVVLNIQESDLPHGSVFIHQKLGVAMVVSHLPAAPAGWKYESWVVPKSGAPRPVESFATDDGGFAFTVVKGPVDVSQWAAVAVSLEPANSTPVKPTKVVFASPV